MAQYAELIIARGFARPIGYSLYCLGPFRSLRSARSRHQGLFSGMPRLRIWTRTNISLRSNRCISNPCCRFRSVFRKCASSSLLKNEVTGRNMATGLRYAVFCHQGNGTAAGRGECSQGPRQSRFRNRRAWSLVIGRAGPSPDRSGPSPATTAGPRAALRARLDLNARM
jgi:hypothetical protein